MTKCEVLNDMRKKNLISHGFPMLNGKEKDDYYNKQLTKEEEVQVRREALELEQILTQEIEKRKCKNCEHWQYEHIDKGHVCVNDKSLKCADWTEADDTCNYWEERKRKEKKKK